MRIRGRGRRRRKTSHSPPCSLLSSSFPLRLLLFPSPSSSSTPTKKKRNRDVLAPARDLHQGLGREAPPLPRDGDGPGRQAQGGLGAQVGRVGGQVCREARGLCCRRGERTILDSVFFLEFVLARSFEREKAERGKPKNKTWEEKRLTSSPLSNHHDQPKKPPKRASSSRAPSAPSSGSRSAASCPG